MREIISLNGMPRISACPLCWHLLFYQNRHFTDLFSLVFSRSGRLPDRQLLLGGKYQNHLQLRPHLAVKTNINPPLAVLSGARYPGMLEFQLWWRPISTRAAAPPPPPPFPFGKQVPATNSLNSPMVTSPMSARRPTPITASALSSPRLVCQSLFSWFLGLLLLSPPFFWLQNCSW